MRTLLLTVTALLIFVPNPTKADTSREVVVRTDGPINVEPQQGCGRIYRGHVALDVLWGEGSRVAIPKGSPVELTVRETGPGEMIVDIQSITVHGRRYVIDTEYEAEIGGGTVKAIPAVIANGEQVQPQGAEIHIPMETVLHFQPPLLVLRPGCRHCM
jgi:hypothetical protein